MSNPTTYDGTITVVQSILTTLTHILHKAKASHLDPTTLLEARLHPDMYPLTDQIRCLTQFTEYLAARLSNREPTPLGNKPTTFPECYERIETVRKVLSEADKDVVNAQGDAVKSTSRGPLGAVDMSGAAYAHMIAIPNIYFHLATAYGILRKEGVELGKMDYYEGFTV